MRSFKLAALAMLVAGASYLASFAVFPPRKTVAAVPAHEELFSLKILKVAQDMPSGSYDAH